MNESEGARFEFTHHASRIPSSLQLTNLHVPKPRLVIVVGEHDVALEFFAELRRALELAFGDARFHFITAEFVGGPGIKILRKQNVRYNRRKQRYELRYYANDNPRSNRDLPLYDIKTDHSEDDNWFKYPFAIFCYSSHSKNQFRFEFIFAQMQKIFTNIVN